MASDSNVVFGFELLNRVFGEQIAKKEDVLILFVHWYFIKNGFKCIGLGDSKTVSPNEIGSELLPEGWNQKPIYSLRYLKEGKLYILLGVKSDADLLFNLMRIECSSVSNVQFPIETTIEQLYGSLENLIPSYQTVLNTLRTDLLEPVYNGSLRHTSTQTSSTDRQEPTQHLDDPLRVHRPQQQPDLHRNPGEYMRHRPPAADPRRVGQDDLNPLGRGAGGMIFDPFGPARGLRPGQGGGAFLGIPGRLPPGAVPPGARFDPLGPVRPPRPPPAHQPDNDHLPFPGYDDMFM